MKPELWKRVEEVLAAALDLPPEQRTRYLDSACKEDSELRREVEELLLMAPDASSFWSTPPMEGLGATFAGPEPPLTEDLTPGSVIGSYRVERLLGSGGMGAVYLASRADDAYEQRVAVKILHPGFAGPDLIGRFLAERQILAVLDHPNIARLLDGGATANGRPFLVMEYVEGVAIDRYCETHQLTVDERLDVFKKVCEAVAFAHRNLVVHRDIKPSNILVTEDGTPKLLDFGIAKLLDTSAFPDMGELTQTGMRPMSPAYASPEQISGRAITTASDVYSLGVVLYKLLTGRLPYDPLQRAIATNERDGRREPTRPSGAVTQVPSPGEDGDQPRRLKRRLEGDIDTIVLTALRDEPERRYGTVDELADDIERHLDGRTVNARPSTLAYRAATFVRRHRMAVGAAVMVTGLMIGSIVALSVQGRRIASERDRAEQMAEFTAGLFEAGGPERTLDWSFTTGEILLQGVARRSRELSDDPELRSDQLLILGRVYGSINNYDSAEEQMLESLRLKEEIFGEDHPEVITGLNGLASLYLGVGRTDDAEGLLERALAIGRSNQSVDQVDLATTNALLASVWSSRWVPEKAIGLLRTAADITQRVRGSHHPDAAMRLVNLADLLNVIDPGSREAEALYQRALEIQMQLTGGEPDTWRTLESLGLLYRDQNRLSLAATMLERAFNAISQTGIFDIFDHSRLAKTLGLVERDRGNLAASENLLKRGLDYEKIIWSPGQPSGDFPLFWDLAGVVFHRGDLDESYEMWKEAHAAWLGYDRILAAIFSQHIALVEQRQGAYASAEPRMFEALAVLDEDLADHDPRLALGLARAARFFGGEGDFGRAEPLQRRALKIWDESDQQHDPAYPQALCHLGQTIMELGNDEEAAELLERARRLIEAQRDFDPSPRKNEVLAEILLVRGDLHRLRGDTERAKELWRESVRVLELNPEGAVGATHRLVAARAWLRLGRPERARPYAEKLIAQGWKWPQMLDQFR